uniref:Myosin head n=1 Tax=Parastrongyloides trichosuri TaxID=131310 RepID=A0A0N4ZL86_PARTI
MSSEFENDEGYPFLAVSKDEKISLTSQPFDSKKNCWIPDPEEGFIAAEITEVQGDKVTVITSRGNQVTLKKDEVQEMNPPKFTKAEDMADLTFLNEASVLANLKQRYHAMMIYTYSGLFCVVINPYKRLPIYTESIIKSYMGKRRNEMPPHLFATSDEAYRNMVMDRENQSMLITGESGAGKTENTKKVIAYFAIVGASQQAAGEKKEGQKGGTLEEQIVQTNPVLEAFGNAKTVRNNNSSRFGKFIRTHFNMQGKLAGGDIEHYLLEKSRVVRQAPGERCYHIFYQLMSGYDKSMRGKLKLDNELSYYHFVSQAELTIDGVDDKEEMRLTQEAFDIMGFEDHETMDLYKNCAGIMHMGEMKFKQRPRDEQAEPDGIDDAINAAFNFGVDAETFVNALVKPRVRVGTEWVNKGQNLAQVHWAVDGLAKAIYARMFKWIIARCNKTLDAKEIPRDLFIGVLDIAGFEIFDFNSFEQLWINFVNEKLQQFFNHHMFVLEQEEYQREGIQWEFIDFGLDLQACIELIEKPMGIISMLDEECIVPKATDMTYADKLIDNHLGKHPNFQKPKPPKGKQAEAHFAIVHYAGTVRYNATNFLEKNKDPLNDTAVAVLKHAEGNALMLELWSDYVTQEEAAELTKQGGSGKRGKSSSFLTVSMIYRESLNNLMTMLYKTHPHFIRCIIPNEKKQSGLIDSSLVLNQLTCNGVLEGIRICRKGFPNRMLYPDFKHRYSILGADAAKNPDPAAASKGITDILKKEGHLTDEEFKIGGTKIFFKAGILARLEDLRDEKLSAIIIGFQAQVRWYLAQVEKKKLENIKETVTIIQENVRSWCTLRTWDWFKLYGLVRPMIKGDKEKEEEKAAIAELNDKIEVLTASLAVEEAARIKLESKVETITKEKDLISEKLEKETAALKEAEEHKKKLEAIKADLDREVSSLNDRVSDMEDRNADLQRQKKKCEQDISDLKNNVSNMDLSIRKLESEKAAKDQNIRSLQDEMNVQDETISKLNKEKRFQEEQNRKLTDELVAMEERLVHMEKLRAKLENQGNEVESNLDYEKKQRSDLEKARRKLESDLKIAQETIDELNTQKHDLEQTLKRKETDLQIATGRLEDEKINSAKLERQIKDLMARINELTDELDNEKQSRSKSERSRAELQRELEDLAEKLEAAGGMSAAQFEINRRREAELARLKRDLEVQVLNHENQLAAIKKRNAESIGELADQLEGMCKMKVKAEAEKNKLQRDLDEANYNVDSMTRQKGELEKQYKTIEIQYAELSTKADEQAKQINEYANIKARLQNENTELNHNIEDLENQLNNTHRIKTQLFASLEETKRCLEESNAERANLAAQFKGASHENDNLRAVLEEERAAKAECMRIISKLNAEIQQWKAKCENDALAKAEEIEEAKRVILAKLTEMTEAYETANLKIFNLEKIRAKLMQDLDDAQLDVEKASQYAAALEKKQKGFERIIEEWKKRCDDIANELDSAQRDNRTLSADLFKAKTSLDEAEEQIEGLRRENKSMAMELKDVHYQLAEGARSVDELQKMLRKVETEKEDLQLALHEAEAALEAEEAKVQRAQIEISQIRSEIEKRLQEKEEEFENTRRNHQRALESMQATLESEQKAKEEALRIKKKLESDINELEIALDHANRANAEAQRSIKKYQEQIRELQFQIEEEQRIREDLQDQLSNSEKRCQALSAEKDELARVAEAAERARRNAEQELMEMREVINDLNNQLASQIGIRKKIEGDLIALQTEFDEVVINYKNAEENLKKAVADAAKLAEELRQEQEHSSHVERMRKGLELQIKEMQVRLDEAEQAALRGGRKIIAQLESRIRALEQELDLECKRHQDTNKVLAKADRRIKELDFQVEEDRKTSDRLTDMVDKLQLKLKTYKRQAEDAEELAATNLTKYKQLQASVDMAEERAEVAENCLSKLRLRSRSSAAIMPRIDDVIMMSSSALQIPQLSQSMSFAGQQPPAKSESSANI